jgi:histidine triad (HIT) family protein
LKGELKRLVNSASVSQDKCVFCRIARGELWSHKVYEDARYVAFLDINPFSRGHTLVCPKEHGETIWDMRESEIGGLFLAASKVSRAVVEATGADGFRFVQNNGEAANQAVAHVHVHVIPVMMEQKGRPMDRMRLEEGEMEATAAAIKDALERYAQPSSGPEGRRCQDFEAFS